MMDAHGNRALLLAGTVLLLASTGPARNTWPLSLSAETLEARVAPRSPLARKNWRGWDMYHVIMWSTGEPKDFPRWFERLREMGCTAEECSRERDAAPFVEHGFGFYAENLVPELAFLHSRQKLYDDDFQGYTTTRDKRFLARKPCFDDPAFWETAKGTVHKLVRSFVAYRPLLYDLRDELSIGSFTSPMDYCFCAHTLRAFRLSLQRQYGTLETLNQEWDTRFASWDEVAPMTTYEVKARERTALAARESENYAPWADHRAFMDLSFAQAIDRLRSYIRELDTDTPVGIEGTQMPSAWGGYDLWRLSQAVDWIEPYDIANSREILRSFLPSEAPVLGTISGSDFSRIRRLLWWRLLHGDRGLIIWDDEKSRAVEKTKEDLPLTDRGKGLAQLFPELKVVAPALYKLDRVDDRIAIHYSQPSIRAHWMFDSREDGDNWPRRRYDHEAYHGRFARVRDSFVRVIEDLGLQSNFVSYEQIENGELVRSGYKVLLLPQSVAMSKRECRQIEAFVRAGGTVIADNMTATMDEHGKRLRAGQLDELFGIRRSGTSWRGKAVAGTLPPAASSHAPLEVYEPDIAVTTGKARSNAIQAPAIIENRAGKGHAFYLNLDMHDYGKYRLSPPKDAGYKRLFDTLLKEAGVAPAVKVTSAASDQPIAGLEIWRYRGGGAECIALMRNPEFDAESLRDEGYPGNAALEQRARLQLVFQQKSQVRDLRSGKILGTTDRVTVDLDAWSPTILELRAHP